MPKRVETAFGNGKELPLYVKGVLADDPAIAEYSLERIWPETEHQTSADEYCADDVAVIGLGDGSVKPLRRGWHGPRPQERLQLRRGLPADAPPSSGIGQKIVRALAQQLGGELHRGPSSQGTRFLVRFPMQRVAAAA
mgnify:CR=1 FL=1